MQKWTTAWRWAFPDRCIIQWPPHQQTQQTAMIGSIISSWHIYYSQLLEVLDWSLPSYFPSRLWNSSNTWVMATPLRSWVVKTVQWIVFCRGYVKVTVLHRRVGSCWALFWCTATREKATDHQCYLTCQWHIWMDQTGWNILSRTCYTSHIHNGCIAISLSATQREDIYDWKKDKTY